MLSYRIVLVAACLLCSRVCTMAQQIAAPPQPPTVMFELSWNQGMPWSDYSFSVMENGATHFKGTVNAAENGQSDSFEQDFTMSEVSLEKIFQSAKAADYFQGHFEGKQKNIAKTGTKTLAFHGPAIDSSTTYDYSPNPNIQQLTKLFQAIAVTIDYGRKLSYQYRFDKLGMDTRLKELVDLRANGVAQEMQAIEPILRKIADDDDVMHLARLEAKQLLKSTNPEPVTTKPDTVTTKPDSSRP
jgi:hypothetical protein